MQNKINELKQKLLTLKNEYKIIREDAEKAFDDDPGIQNIFDSTWFFKNKYPVDYQKYTSENEVRVKNRLIKVWKRIG
jgi:hypothetical protein